MAARQRLLKRMQDTLRAAPSLESVDLGADVPLTGGNGATLYAWSEGNVPPVSKRTRRSFA